MSYLWHIFLYQPILNALILFYRLFSNLGVAIVALTVLVRLILIPLMNPQLKAAQKMQELAPELEKLKKKFKNDKQKLMQAQMELYKRQGVNPASGCLPQILQFIILISLYQAFNQVIKPDGVGIIEKINQNLYAFVRLPAETKLNLKFLYLDLSKPDLIRIPDFLTIPGVFVILATVFQFLSSKMMMPRVSLEQKQAEKTETQQDDVSAAMQKQMLYLFPIMTLVFGLTMPSGVMLYWFIFSLFSFIQQYLINREKSQKIGSYEKR